MAQGPIKTYIKGSNIESICPLQNANDHSCGHDLAGALHYTFSFLRFLTFLGREGIVARSPLGFREKLNGNQIIMDRTISKITTPKRHQKMANLNSIIKTLHYFNSLGVHRVHPHSPICTSRNENLASCHQWTGIPWHQQWNNVCLIPGMITTHPQSTRINETLTK